MHVHVIVCECLHRLSGLSIHYSVSCKHSSCGVVVLKIDVLFLERDLLFSVFWAACVGWSVRGHSYHSTDHHLHLLNHIPYTCR